MPHARAGQAQQIRPKQRTAEGVNGTADLYAPGIGKLRDGGVHGRSFGGRGLVAL